MTSSKIYNPKKVQGDLPLEVRPVMTDMSAPPPSPSSPSSPITPRISPIVQWERSGTSVGGYKRKSRKSRKSRKRTR